jgi:16S rRNA processing protein RimM
VVRSKNPPPSPKPPPSNPPGTPYAGDESRLVVMGRILAPFGIQGWIKLKTFTEEPDGLARHPTWWLGTKAGWRSARPQDFQVRPAAVTAKLEGVEDRSAAELLRGCDVAVTREDLGAAKKGEYFWVDLEGLEVVNLQGEALGRVESLLRTGGADVLVVRGGRERLIPFVADFVQSVDRDARRITVDWEAGYDV